MNLINKNSLLLYMKKLEVCCADIESVIAAKEAGADRIELCTGLEVGGLTPSIGLIKKAVEIFGAGVMVLIRERAGDFNYSPSEIEVMGDDIEAAINEGATGVVIGALTADGELDLKALGQLMLKTSGVEVTFHRAFDELKDPMKALEQIIEVGCHRILTSGQKPTAEEGIPLLRELIKVAGDRIIILPGSGINDENVDKILKETGCKEIHGSAKVKYHGTCKSSPEKIIRIKKYLE